MSLADNYRNTGFTVYEASLYRLAAEHRHDVAEEPGGWAWHCSCGRGAGTLYGYPSQAQAVARGHRHLRAARQRIQREIEAAIDLGGCGTVWTDPQGVIHTCNEHRRDLLFIHADDVALWDGGTRYEAR